MSSSIQVGTKINDFESKNECYGQPLGKAGHTCKTVSANGPIVKSLELVPVAVPSAKICMTYIFAFETEGAVTENSIDFASLCVSIDVFSTPTICVEPSGNGKTCGVLNPT